MNWNRIIAVVTVVLIVIFAGIYMYERSTPRNQTVNSIEIPGHALDDIADAQLSDLKKNLGRMTETGSVQQETSDRILIGAKKYVENAKLTNMPVDAFDLNMTVLKDAKLITAEDFEAIKAAVEKEVTARKEKAYGPFVKEGIFASLDEAEKAMTIYNEKLSKLLSEQKATLQEIFKSANPPLTDDEKKKRIEDFKNDQPKRVDAVLKEMVTAGNISDAQVEKLKAFLVNK